jgi:hypothetical protein
VTYKISADPCAGDLVFGPSRVVMGALDGPVGGKRWSRGRPAVRTLGRPAARIFWVVWVVPFLAPRYPPARAWRASLWTGNEPGVHSSASRHRSAKARRSGAPSPCRGAFASPWSRTAQGRRNQGWKEAAGRLKP